MGVEQDPGGRDAVVRPETAHARVSLPPPRVVTHSRFDDGSESINVGSEEFRSSSITGSDDQRQDFHGRPAQGEEDVLQVCRSLRAALQREGEAWDSFSLPPSSQDDVDAIAQDGTGGVLRVQVTRVEHAAWERLARDRQATLQRTIGERVADIRAAVESKSKRYPPAQRSKLLLALDAIRSPGHVHDAVVEAFLRDHGQWAAAVGYRAIWLVGPTAALTRQLY